MKRALLSIAALAFLLAPGAGLAEPQTLPTFQSLKASEANGRRGPSLEQPIVWVYRRAGLPVEVVGKSGAWRKIKDPDGAVTWVHHDLLGPGGTVLITGENGGALALTSRTGRVLAYLRPGVIADFQGCEEGRMRVSVRGRVGFVDSDGVWGARCS